MQKFDFNKIDDFDRHIDLSIPNYSFLKEHIKYLIETLTEDHSNIIDLGCSTGNLLLSLDRKNTCNYYGFDTSNLLSDVSEENLSFKNYDITKVDYPDNTSIISSIFTLQFLPRQKRKEVIQKAYNSLNEGGYFILCEKTHSNDVVLENITNSIYYRFKSKNFNPDEILKKQQELACSMKLKTITDIEDELSIFKFSEVFWKSYGFAGFIARK